MLNWWSGVGIYMLKKILYKAHLSLVLFGLVSVSADAQTYDEQSYIMVNPKDVKATIGTSLDMKQLVRVQPVYSDNGKERKVNSELIIFSWSSRSLDYKRTNSFRLNVGVPVLVVISSEKKLILWGELGFGTYSDVIRVVDIDNRRINESIWNVCGENNSDLNRLDSKLSDIDLLVYTERYCDVDRYN